jgi:hypothetical protein
LHILHWLRYRKESKATWAYETASIKQNKSIDKGCQDPYSLHYPQPQLSTYANAGFQFCRSKVKGEPCTKKSDVLLLGDSWKDKQGGWEAKTGDFTNL